MVPCEPAVKQQAHFPPAQKRQDRMVGNGLSSFNCRPFFSREEAGQALRSQKQAKPTPPSPGSSCPYSSLNHTAALPLLFPEPHSCPAPTLLTARQVNKIRPDSPSGCLFSCPRGRFTSGKQGLPALNASKVLRKSPFRTYGHTYLLSSLSALTRALRKSLFRAFF